MNRVLVAGATGYLGRFVAREFKERGDWVRVLARKPEKLKTAGPSLEPAIADLVDDVFVGEVTRPETLRGLCEGDRGRLLLGRHHQAGGSGLLHGRRLPGQQEPP